MKPIPKTLLIHSASLFDVSENEWQKQTFELVAELRYVRIEPASRLVTNGKDRTVTLSAVLFYDLVNSSPRGVRFKQGQRLNFGSLDYVVETIEELYDSKKLHHLEVGLCL